MRIVKCEKIFLSQNESDIWTEFDKILDGLERGCENPDTKNLINKIQSVTLTSIQKQSAASPSYHCIHLFRKHKTGRN